MLIVDRASYLYYPVVHVEASDAYVDLQLRNFLAKAEGRE